MPSARWQIFVNERPIASLVLVGVIATQLGTYFGYVFPAFGLPVPPWPLYNGILGTTFQDGGNGLVNIDGTLVAAFATSGESFFVGHSLNFVNGIVFAILFGILFREDVPIKNTFGGNILKGLVYSVIMSIISIGLLVPSAYVPNSGYRLFLFDGPDGWKLPFAILVWHVIYGLFLGLPYQPTRVDIAEPAPRALTLSCGSALDYAAAVNEEIHDLFAAGADIVQIDEPYMQARPTKDREFGLVALARAIDGVTGTVAVHICFGYAAIIHERPEGYSFLPEFAGSGVAQISIETAQSNLDTSVLASLPGKR